MKTPNVNGRPHYRSTGSQSTSLVRVLQKIVIISFLISVYFYPDLYMYIFFYYLLVLKVIIANEQISILLNLANNFTLLWQFCQFPINNLTNSVRDGNKIVFTHIPSHYGTLHEENVQSRGRIWEYLIR